MKVDKKLFIPSLGILLTIVVLIMTNLSMLQTVVEDIYNACISNFGWFFVLINIACIVFSLWVIFGPYKNIKLGGEEAKPTFSFISWAGMMFTTSCGAWLIVYGFLEPIYCSAQAPFQIEPLTTPAFEMGQAYAHFHWGPNAWSIYVPISVAIGYLLYNRNLPASMGSACKIVLNGKTGSMVAYLADLCSVCSAVIAPVISLGTGMPLLVILVQNIFGISDAHKTSIEIGILCVWILIFGTSVFLGLDKGIKRLSNLNITLAFLLMALIGLIAGVFECLSAEVNTIGVLLDNYMRMTTYTDPYGSGSFVKGWTIGYWACYFVFMPLMGVFNAKISKGRRLKEIAFGQLVLCTLGCWAAMATFGNYTTRLQVGKQVDIAGFLDAGDEAGAVLAVIQSLPASEFMMVVLFVVCFIFLATTMDSSAFSAAEMTMRQDGDETLAPRWLRITWAAVASVFAFALLQVGGVKAVRSLCYIAGLPLAVLTIIVIVSVVRMLKQDHALECEDTRKINVFK